MAASLPKYLEEIQRHIIRWRVARPETGLRASPNLRTFETTLATSEAPAPFIPEERLMIGAGGIFTPDDLTRPPRVGMSAFLVGESPMRQPDVTAATQALLARDTPVTAAGIRSSRAAPSSQ